MCWIVVVVDGDVLLICDLSQGLAIGVGAGASPVRVMRVEVTKDDQSCFLMCGCVSAMKCGSRGGVL